MLRGMLNCTTFMNQPLQMYVKMETAFTTRTISQMLLNDLDFLRAEFPINVQMKTSGGPDTI
jgi:hypothetical protein